MGSNCYLSVRYLLVSTIKKSSYTCSQTIARFRSIKFAHLIANRIGTYLYIYFIHNHMILNLVRNSSLAFFLIQFNDVHYFKIYIYIYSYFNQQTTKGAKEFRSEFSSHTIPKTPPPPPQHHLCRIAGKRVSRYAAMQSKLHSI